MSEKSIPTRIVATNNRAEPLLGSVASGAVSSDKVWR